MTMAMTMTITITMTMTMTMIRPGKKLEGGDGKVSGDTLTLLRVTPEEAGVYICTATNQHSRWFSLSVITVS